jgi:outer membrane protein assembly factor BamA
MDFNFVGVRHLIFFRRYTFVFGIVLLLVLNACSSVKYVPEDKYLLAKVKVKSTRGDFSKAEINSLIRTKENLRILAFWKFHLGLYNLSGRDTSHWINRVLKRMGEEPVIYDEGLQLSSRKQLENLFFTRGYFQGTVADTAIFYDHRKAKIIYRLSAGPRYRINHTSFKIEDDSLRASIESDSLRTALKKGRPFDTELFEQERERITIKLRNEGYYNFSKEYIYFRLDSALNNYSINDTVVLKRPFEEGTFPLHRKSIYRNVYYIISRNPQKALLDADESDVKFDTLVYKGVNFLFNDRIEVHPSVLYNSSYVVPGELYNAANVEKTRQLLASLSYFRYIDIRMKEMAAPSDSVGVLDCFIQLIPAHKYFYSVELEGTNSSGNLGAGGNFKFQNRNLFRGAEVLDLGFSASLERQYETDKEKFNTFEIGADAGIEFPKFLGPFNADEFRKKYNPRTSVQIAYNYQRRPEYTRTIANLRWGYNWRSSRYLYHYLFPSELNLVWLPSISSAFWDRIDSTFLKYSYENHFILNSNYSLVYNTQTRIRQPEFFYGRLNIEAAGNLLHAMMPLWQKRTGDNPYDINGIQFAQYSKAEVEIRYHHAVNKLNSFAYRFIVGVAYPYGNLKVLPFEKRYFSGGANSIRAWSVRGLGPGTYIDTLSTYYNQTADIKLEANAEYRFKLMWVFEGALFVDAGNIWDIRSDAHTEGGLFKWSDFYKQIAVGTGFGLRSDFDYFLLRLDMGVKALDPSQQKWVLGRDAFRWRNLTFNFAIGYPF